MGRPTTPAEARSPGGYRPECSYEFNYEHVPPPVDIAEPAVPGEWSFCGRTVPSPLGIAAGPLLNGAWVRYYASLGFDVLTYKTVRSRARACYEMPNLQPVDVQEHSGAAGDLPARHDMQGSWAISFGMPSRSPEVWRADVERTRAALADEKILSVSVVATPEEDWSADQIAEDYARCARWAAESGADAIECNFSCPNVATCDGQLFQKPDLAATVAGRVRSAIGGEVPLLLKVGHLTDAPLAAELCRSVAEDADALVMTNCIPATVRDEQGRPMFGGQKRGIGGRAIRDASISMVRQFAETVRREKLNLRLVGVGGIETAEDVAAYLSAGAECVQLATAAMLDPEVGLKIRTRFGSVIPAAS